MSIPEARTMPATRHLSFSFLGLLLVGHLVVVAAPDSGGRGPAWVRHTIDDSSRGADGVRLADVNGDGLLDVCVGWEEGGLVRVYLHPGHKKAKQKWPAVTVGKVRSPEDAVFVDVDGDGAIDVVSCCEGKTQQVFVHWAPKDRGSYLDPEAWKTESIPALKGMTRWMYGLPLQVDGRHGMDLVLGSKAPGAQVGWLEAPANPRDLSAWKWHRLYEAGWIMSLEALDVDADGDVDVVVSDRKGKKRGCLWLEHPGQAQVRGPWKEHRIGPQNKQVMFLDLGDLDGDGIEDLIVPTSPRELFFCRRLKGTPVRWQTQPLPYPDGLGTGKGVGVADLDGDGRKDVVLTCENASGNRSGAVWLSGKPGARDWTVHDISGPTGVKYDLVQLVDIDGDGDLDLMTTEERASLGVIWYENPAR
jgi:hypothetical protein